MHSNILFKALAFILYFVELGGFIEFTGMKFDALAARGYYFSVNSGFSQTLRSGRCIHALFVYYIKQLKYLAMKRMLTIFAILTTMVMSSCSKYDDSEIRQKLNALEDRIAAIETLLKASADKLTVIDITETDEGTVITFSDNSKVTIGKATDTKSPIVNIEVDGDVVYITLDDGTVLTFKKYEINENHKIYYTTTDGKKLSWGNSYDLNSYTNTYENGQGVLAFDKPVIYVGLSYAKTLKTIVIPETVVEVGSFFNCENLTEIYCKATTPPTTPPTGYTSDPIKKYPYNFLDYASNSSAPPRSIGCTIYVPMESVEAYKKAECWSKYANYIKGYDFE